MTENEVRRALANMALFVLQEDFAEAKELARTIPLDWVSGIPTVREEEQGVSG